jgi:hypothetical protein
MTNGGRFSSRGEDTLTPSPNPDRRAFARLALRRNVRSSPARVNFTTTISPDLVPLLNRDAT